MRINMTKRSDGSLIFGALNFDLIKFLAVEIRDEGKVFLFVSKNHGVLFCDIWMLKRIKERLRVNRQDLTVINEALRVIN